MDCPGLSPQRRFQPGAILSLLRCGEEHGGAIRQGVGYSPGGGRKREGDLSVARSREHPSPAKGVSERRHAASFIA